MVGWGLGHTVYFAFVLYVEEWVEVDITVEMDVRSAITATMSRGETKKIHERTRCANNTDICGVVDV